MPIFDHEIKNHIRCMWSYPILLDKGFFHIHYHALKSWNNAALERQEAFNIDCVVQEN